MGNSNNYQILNTIATGSTAVLYKAIQTSLDRKVVVKKLHAHLTGDPDFTRRFELEAKTAASLDHENIVRIIDSGVMKGNYFIVMEYINGSSLKELLDDGAVMNEEIALLIAHQICLGLEHAHQRGIIHRDIKPANIMISREGMVKITDFGLAKLKKAGIQQTVADTLVGTPLYMSPEQAIGEGLDNRSDIFSLGTICYEMVSGKQPFTGDNYAAVIQNIISGTVTPPSRLVEVSGEAEQIIMKALSRRPAKRFRSAGEMAAHIENLLGREKVLSARRILKRFAFGGGGLDSYLDKPPKTKKKKRKLIPAAAALAVASALALGIFRPVMTGEIIAEIKEAVFRNPAAPAERILSAQNQGLGPQVQILDAAADTFRNRPEKIDTASSAPAGEVVADTAGTALPPPEPAEPETLIVEVPVPVEEKKEAPVEAAPKKPEGLIDIHVKPKAAIYIDGRQRLFGNHLGPMPLTSGRHSILIKRSSYKSYSEVITVKKDELSRRRITLERVKGEIAFDTQTGVRIFVDGKMMGITPVSRPISLPSGTHLVKLEKDGYIPWENRVEVQPEKTITLSVSLVPE